MNSSVGLLLFYRSSIQDKGPYTHANGYKIHLKPNTELDNCIYSEGTKMDNNGATQYSINLPRAMAILAKETEPGDAWHWDITIIPKLTIRWTIPASELIGMRRSTLAGLREICGLIVKKSGQCELCVTGGTKETVRACRRWASVCSCHESFWICSDN